MARPRRWSLTAVLLLTYALTVLIVVGALGFLVERAARHALLAEVRVGLTQQALAVAGFADVANPQEFVDGVAAAVDPRVTLIGADGSVLGDSLRDPESMENHARRPEVQAAMAGRVGSDERVSATTGFSQLYVAVPGPDGTVLRLSLAENTIRARQGALRSTLATLIGVAALLGVVVVALVARLLTRPLTRLASSASAVATGRLDIDVPRSSVVELDELGRSIGSMAGELGDRLRSADSERRTLEVVLESLPQGILLIGAEDGIVYANKTVGQIVGPVPDRLERVTPFRVQEMVRRARKDGRVVDIDLEHGRPARILRVIATPLEDGRVLVVVSDITARRRVDDVRRDFVTNASHELKTPVASLLASAETLQIALDKAPERVPQFASQIEQAARSLSRMIADLLDLSRLEGRMMEFEDVSLPAVVITEVDRLRPLADTRGVVLHVESEAASVHGSPADLGLAIRNLVENALRYTETGGDVTIRVERRGEEAVIEVTDTGAGIPQRDLDRIFERFYRVDVARSRATGGTGLGLSIVRHVVESHGGTVSVVSQLGAGSTFTIRLPIADGS